MNVMDSADREPLLWLRDIGFTRPGGPHWQGRSAGLMPGLTVVHGEEGAGKSTLLRLLAAELLPQQGDLVLCGVSVRDHRLAYQAQVFWCDPQSDAHRALPARDYLAWHRQRHGTWQDEVLQAHLEALDLPHHLDKPLYALSTGTLRKLRLAAAFAAGAPLTLLDDPLAALDRRSIDHVMAVLHACQALSHRLVVVAMHELPRGLTGINVSDW
ncbi:MAG: ABC transporter [Polaromonas sp.]|nr:ABC transporter [Polaromonas sp.]